MLRSVALVRTDDSEESIAFIIKTKPVALSPQVNYTD
jgi:hypothetical protein